MAATTTVGAGKYTYDVDEDWAKLPEGWEMPAAAVYGDSKDRVFCFNPANSASSPRVPVE